VGWDDSCSVSWLSTSCLIATGEWPTVNTQRFPCSVHFGRARPPIYLFFHEGAVEVPVLVYNVDFLEQRGYRGIAGSAFQRTIGSWSTYSIVLYARRTSGRDSGLSGQDTAQ
jgi:hypothetical protein